MKTKVRFCLLSVALALAVPVTAQQPEPTKPEPLVVKMTAKKYAFDPPTITVERGRTVRIEATAVDHDHGIEIEEFKVKARLDKGKPTIVEFTPDRTGEFTMKCSVFCGFGHRGMKGKLVVVEPAPKQ